MVFNKKAISPVVATALLLVVAVVAVVGFQQWFQTYNSGLMAGVDEKSATSSGITVEMVQNSTTAITVFLKNPSTVDITQVTIDIPECSGESTGVTVTPGIATSGYVVDNCFDIAPTTPVTVVVKTSEGIYRETEVVSK